MKDKFKKFVSLNDFVTPKVLTFFYRVSLLFVVAYSFLILFFGIMNGMWLQGVIGWLLAIVFAPLTVRIMFEFAKLPFVILEELKKKR